MTGKILKWFAIVVLGISVLALPWPASGVETGTGTNQNGNVTATNSISLRGTIITSWSDISGGDLSGLSNNVIVLQGTTGVLNTAVGNLQGATGALNTAISTEATTRGNADTALQNNIGFASNSLGTAVGNLQNATNALNTRAVQWDNAVVMKEGSGSIAFSNLYYYKSDGSWAAANASSTNTARGMLGLALGSSIADDGLLLNGYCTNSWGFAVGSVIYMDTNNGALATSRPTGANNVVRIVGYAVSATKIYFNPDRTFIKISGE